MIDAPPRLPSHGSTATPSVEVLVDASERLDLDAVNQRATALAFRLRAERPHPHSPIGVALRRRLDGIVAIIACRLLGTAYVPLDPDFPPARLATMIATAQPGLVIVDDQTASRFDGLVRTIRFVEPGSDAPVPDFAANRGRPEHDALAYILFTSGSTGTPKGVAMRADPVERLIAWHAAHPRLGRPARTLQFAPLGFDVSWQEIFSTRACGGCLVAPEDSERRDPYALLNLIARERIARLFIPYVGLQALAEAVATGGEAPITLRDVITAGEQLRITPALRAMFAALPDCVLHNHYGPTETHVVTVLELDGDPADWPELPAIGHELPHVLARLVDGEGRDVADGDEGELLLGGNCLAAGYVNAPDLTAERFIEAGSERWYRTGDRARRDTAGQLHCLGRLDTQIKLDGFRVEPAEIEVVLGRHSDVAEAVVVASRQAGAMQLHAHLVARDADNDWAALIADVRAHAEARLAPYLLPHRYRVHAALPLTPNGKIDRRALADADDVEQPAWPTNASLEMQMTAMWQQLLGVESIARDDNLFEHGARSLTVVRALTQLRAHGHRLSAAQVYEYPTIAAQLALLDRGSPNDTGINAASQRGEQQRNALKRFGPGAKR